MTYLSNTGPNNYPWLFDYDVNNLDEFSGSASTGTAHPVGSLTNIGRIPSIFSTYFSDANSQPIESRLFLSASKQFEVPGDPNLHTLSFSQATANVLGNVTFSDSGTDTGQLSADAVAESYQDELYFWSNAPPSPVVWTVCPNGGDALSDCNQDGSGAPTPGSPSNLTEIRVLRVAISVDFSAGAGMVVDLNYSTPPAISYTPASSSPDEHAKIRASFQPNNVTGFLKISADRGIYSDSTVFTSSFYGEQDLTDNSDIVLFGGADVINQSSGNVTFGLFYYPELPRWAHTTEDNWHNSIMMAIAPDHQPGGFNDCLTIAPPCLTLNGSSGVIDDKVSLLVLAGEVAALVDDGIAGFSDDLGDIFDAENADILDIDGTEFEFDRNDVVGNDTILVLQ